MLAVKMPDETIPRKRGEWINPRVTYTPDELEFIRASAKTMTDRQIADAMGWTVVRVMGVRRTNRIPSSKGIVWTPEKLEKLHELYIVQGMSSGVVCDMLGVTAAALRIKSAKMGWVHDPAHTYRNRTIAVRASLAVRGRGVRRRSVEVAAPAHVAREPVLVPSGLHLDPIVFASPPTESETLGDRILRELSAKPLSAASLATLLGEKELLVSMQLSAFAHEGRVEAGPVGDRGLRYRVWSVVDQSSAVAQIAASLRCGPDSLVVAGEAA